jgi:EmrB/QacA subfamily drug resistance transporter
MTTTQTAAPSGLDAALLKLIGAIMLGTLAVQLDSTMTNVAFNALIKEFHEPLSTIQWVATGYLLAMATMIPLTGWAVERFGAKRLWMACLAGFLVGSVLCGLSWSVGSLIVFRVVQGLGGGMLIPLGQIVLVTAAGPQRFGRAASVMGVPALLGPVLGPVLGGLIVDDLSWRWIFFVNVPVCLLGLLVSARVLPATPPEHRLGARLDYVGLTLLSPSLVFIVYGLSAAGAHASFTGGAALWGLIAGAVLLAGFIGHALRTERTPLIELRLFRARGFASASAVTVLICLGAFGATILLPLYFQQVRGETPLHAGLSLAPQGLGLGLALIVAGRLSDRIGPRWIVLSGIALLLGGSAILTRVRPGFGGWSLTGALLLVGAGLGAVLVATMTASVRGLGPGEIPRATTALRIFQQIGISLGVAVLSVILQQRVSRTHVAPGDTVHLAAAYAHTFRWQFALLLLAVVPGLLLPATLRARSAAS